MTHIFYAPLPLCIVQSDQARERERESCAGLLQFELRAQNADKLP